MVDIINLNSNGGANMIADDAQPTLTLENTGGGVGLKTSGLVVVSGASIDTVNISTLGVNTIQGTATTSPVLTLSKTVLGTASTATFVLPVASVASGPAIQLAGTAFVSAVSIVFAASANWAGLGALRVRVTDNSFRWIPLLPDGTVTAAVWS